MSTLQPRAVIVTRETDYERLLAAHATRQQAGFFLKTRAQKIDDVAARHEAFQVALARVRTQIPDSWRVARVMRSDLDRFSFSPADVVVAVGQDGLVANLAKYVDGQPVLGVNPDPATIEGVLAPLTVDALGGLLPAAAAGQAPLQKRTMAEAVLDDGQILSALNEIFVGHRTHQSARYRISHSGQSENQSSSGIIVSTGTGATGWARSIMNTTGQSIPLAPTDRRLAFFVREPWPSVATGATITAGAADQSAPVVVRSQMNDGGVIFADGIEQDFLDFGWGRTVTVRPSARSFNLVRPA